jgi:hypothetical protein
MDSLNMIGMETSVKVMRTQKIVMICKRRTNLIILLFHSIAISFSPFVLRFRMPALPGPQTDDPQMKGSQDSGVPR